MGKILGFMQQIVYDGTIVFVKGLLMRLGLSLASAVLIVISSNAVSAATRNCTATEKQRANAELLRLQTDSQAQATLMAKHARYGLPATTILASNEQALFQNGYIMGHDGDLLTALWVSYSLTKSDIEEASGKDRVNCFRKDPRLARNIAASTSDYKEPIFDQGHMTNDADLKDDVIEQVNTYVMSNMSPQYCRFNRGIWLSLEHLGRIWAKKYGEIQITSGAIFDADGAPGRDLDSAAARMKSNNGKERVGVPSHYYKSFARNEGGVVKTITFALAHNNDDNGVDWADVSPAVMRAIVPLQTVETAASLDLYPSVTATSLAESLDGSDWDFSVGLRNFAGSCK